MRISLILLLVLTSFSAVAQRNIDVLHYKYSIELNDANDSIYGVAEIKLRFLDNADSFTFDVKGKGSDGKGMVIDKITGPDLKGFTAMKDSITVNLTTGTALSKMDTVTYTFHYHGIPADGLIISKSKFGKRTFFADNWPNRAHHWIPCVDNPADKASVEFIVTAPNHYQVISNGIKLEELDLAGERKRTHWKEDVPLPTKVMVIGVADFAVEQVGNIKDTIAVSSWVYPENRENGFGDYAMAKDILEFYIGYIGPYAYKKLANVQSKTIFGGMENASAIFYAEETVNGKKDQERLIAHEIVHQWFGNMATEKSFAHLWLSEGFATYLSYLYIEHKYGAGYLDRLMKNDRQTVLSFAADNPRPVVDSTSDYMSLLNANSYQKGGWILHMLRRELGNPVFKKAIQKYYETYTGKNAETADLQKIVEKVSGRNLSQFFTQWLYTGENPELGISWKYDAATKKIAVTVTQLQRIPFNFPLEILTVGNKTASSKVFRMNITRKTETFQLTAAFPVVQVVADPYTSLLGTFKVNKSTK